MRISDWSSDVCSSDLRQGGRGVLRFPLHCTGRSLRFLAGSRLLRGPLEDRQEIILQSKTELEPCRTSQNFGSSAASARSRSRRRSLIFRWPRTTTARTATTGRPMRSEEHTSELKSLMRSSYAVFCLKTKNIPTSNKHYR